MEAHQANPLEEALRELGVADVSPAPPRRLSDVAPSTSTPPMRMLLVAPQWVDRSECDGCGPGNKADGVRLCESCTVEELVNDVSTKSHVVAVMQLMADGESRSRNAICDGVTGSRQKVWGAITWLIDHGYLASLYIGSGQSIYAARTSTKPEFESEPERMFWEANDILGRPLQQLTAQHVVGRYRLDFAIVDAKRAIEVDGLAWHNGQASFINDRERQRRLEMDGWRVLRFAAKEVMSDAEGCVRQAAEWAGA